jgi:release factor glutamine methyltransferase
MVAFDRMLERRLTGEPLQYVLGSWSFRHLDLYLDRRVLIPRPETEVVTEHALAEHDRSVASRGERTGVVVDLGTGSGAIALSIAYERNGTEVWATDRSADALAVAQANCAGLGRVARHVTLLTGSWFDPLPAALRGRVDVVVSNPPYVAASEELPPEVRDWEPVDALVPGPRGLEAYEAIAAEAGAWLIEGGALVLEIGATQAAAVSELLERHAFASVAVHRDLAGRDRVVVARR